MYVPNFLGEVELINCTDYICEHFWKTTKWLDDAEFSSSLYGKITHTKFKELQKIVPHDYRNNYTLNRMRLLYVPHGVRASGFIETPEKPIENDTFILAFTFITPAKIQIGNTISYINPGDLFAFQMDEKIVIDNEQSDTCSDIKAYGICIVCTKGQRPLSQK